jgi:hypothetical protein
MNHLSQVASPVVTEFSESPVDQGGYERPDYSYLADLAQPDHITAGTLSEDYAEWGDVVPALGLDDGNKMFVGPSGSIRSSGLNANQDAHLALFEETELMCSVVAPGVLPPAYESGDIVARDALRPGAPSPERFRNTLSGLNVRQGRLFDGYVGRCAETALGRHSELVQHKPVDEQWASWLAEHADDEQILAVMTQHSIAVQEINEDRNVQIIAEGRRAWLADRLRRCVSSGRLNPFALKVAGKVSGSDVKIWFGDDLRDHFLSNGSDGYCAPDGSYIVMRQHLDMADPAKRRDAALKGMMSSRLPHELLHAGEVAEWLPNWMTEVAVEDLTQLVIHDDELKALDPSSPGVPYPNYREMRQTLLEGGRRKIDSRTYFKAISSEDWTSPDATRFIHEIDSSWGVHNVIGLVRVRLNYYERLFEAKHSGDPEWYPAYVKAAAAKEVDCELREEPELIFNAVYKKPQPHVGAAALSSSLR